MLRSGGSGGGAAATPGGASGTVQYNNAGAFGGMSGTSWDDTNRALTITGATVTTSNPILDLSQTWNAGAVAFTGFKFNITNTASAAASTVFDFQVGGVSKLNMDNAGLVAAGGTLAAYSNFYVRAGAAGAGLLRCYADDSGVYIGTSGAGALLAFCSGSAFAGGDTGFSRTAAATLALGNGTVTNASGTLKLATLTATSATGSVGYGTGAGGAITQITSRTTGVTLNNPTGAITLFSAAGSAVAASFTVTNSIIAATDTSVLSVKSGTNKYQAFVTAVNAGSFEITFMTTGGVATDSPVINFAIVKGVAS